MPTYDWRGNSISCVSDICHILVTHCVFLKRFVYMLTPNEISRRSDNFYYGFSTFNKKKRFAAVYVRTVAAGYKCNQKTFIRKNIYISIGNFNKERDSKSATRKFLFMCSFYPVWPESEKPQIMVAGIKQALGSTLGLTLHRRNTRRASRE